MTAHYVYRLYDAADELIYIGCSMNVAARMTHHRGHQPWWHEVIRIDASEVHPDQPTARAAERAAILADRPKHNIHHASGHQVECEPGSYAGYKRHRVRGQSPCSSCFAAYNEFQRTRHARALARGSLTHGKGGTYSAGCRCDPCRAAGSEARRRAYEVTRARLDQATA